eukprot:gnl/MRDRNA2_/MRDRNA2_86751_c0_seq1.p1 gnl/MRDRNA2_/MRDRNA2_86751_c0~~gnl/MRDRNA2_/MRDRNA2_86751_c0_seq1.p1  ORF type:complete len:753 (+),score=-45.39 gnl/MRDRNA2_/MRDRNA2_86751_c0_seq1:551-2809(+)
MLIKDPLLCKMKMNNTERNKCSSFTAKHFNQRFFYSLAARPHCLVIDGKFNLFNESTIKKNIKRVSALYKYVKQGYKNKINLITLCLHQRYPAKNLLNNCKNLDQAKAVLTLLNTVLESTQRSFTTVMAKRGRGKSACFGLVIAGALALGFTDISVMAIHSECVRVLFEFVLKGLESLDFYEHVDFQVFRNNHSSLPFQGFLRIELNTKRRQFVQYIRPSTEKTKSDLLVIEEVTSIPHLLIDRMLGTCPVFLSCSHDEPQKKIIKRTLKSNSFSITLLEKKIYLKDPIRYSSMDQVETWLYQVLCLNREYYEHKIPNLMPHPHKCDLFHVNADQLLSYCKDSEAFLQTLMTFYAFSNHKYSSNDILLLSFGKLSHLFVLLSPLATKDKIMMPNILCLVQTSLQGIISLSRPVGTNFDQNIIHFGLSKKKVNRMDQLDLSGVKLIFLAVHPSYTKFGYGTRAIHILERYYSGKFNRNLSAYSRMGHENNIYSNQCNLLSNLYTRPAEVAQYIEILADEKTVYFWIKRHYEPLIFKKINNPNILMFRMVGDPFFELDWNFLTSLKITSRNQSIETICYNYSYHPLSNIHALLKPKLSIQQIQVGQFKSKRNVDIISFNDFNRLLLYCTKKIDYSLITDLIYRLTRIYLSGRISVKLNHVQIMTMISIGLQRYQPNAIKHCIPLREKQVLMLQYIALKKLTVSMKRSRGSTAKFKSICDISLQSLAINTLNLTQRECMRNSTQIHLVHLIQNGI